MKIIMALHFDKYAQEGNEFINKLAKDLGHPDERERTSIILKSVLHTLRDRITIAESMDLLSQLPMFLKAAYVDQWKYKEQPENFRKLDEFTESVKEHQNSYGESRFPWSKPTLEITTIVLAHIGNYFSEGQVRHIMKNLPEEIAEMIEGAMLEPVKY